VVDVHVGGHHRPHPLERKTDFQLVGPRLPVRRRLGPLEQTAVDQQAVEVVDEELVTGTGDPVKSTVMDDVCIHGPAF
jgi:hypothetical protein